VDVEDLLVAYHTAAHERAVERNRQRASQLAEAVAALEPWYRRGTAGWVTSWFRSSPSERPHNAPVALAVSTAVAEGMPPVASSSALSNDCNTDDEGSDHSGASARIAGLPGHSPASPELLAADASAAPDDAFGHAALTEQVIAKASPSFFSLRICMLLL
jgi:hypothetical protein